MWINIREGSPKQIQSVNFFQRGGGWPQSLHLKSLYIMKRVFKISFFNTRICFNKFWEQQKKFCSKKSAVVMISCYFGLQTFLRKFLFPKNSLGEVFGHFACLNKNTDNIFFFFIFYNWFKYYGDVNWSSGLWKNLQWGGVNSGRVGYQQGFFISTTTKTCYFH